MYGPLFPPPIFPNIWLQRAGSREKIAAFLKPCDTYSFQQLCKEHRVQRAAVYAVAVQCEGMCDMEQLQAQAKAPLAVREEGETLVVETLYGEKRLPRQTVLAERCRSCKTKRWPAMTSFWERTAQTAGTAGWRACAVWRR